MPRTTIEFDVQDRRARAGFDRLQRELRETESGLQQTNRTARDTQNRFVAAGRGADTFGKSLGGVRGILTGLGIAAAVREIISFGASSVRAAGQIEGLKRGLEAIEGENATQRLRDFNEIAKLPGLNTPQIIRYSNSLRAAGATTSEVDQIIISFGQSIVGLGGSAADTSRAMLQLTQAFGENKISQENFSTIKELIPSFNRLAKEVYDTDGSMDALNQRFKASGQTLGQFLLPILARLRQEIPAAPVDSYARSVDALGEEFQQFKIAIGTELLPVVSATARGLAGLFDTMTKGVQVVGDFFDVVDEEHQALLNASESAREFAIRLTDINNAAGQQEAVSARIQQLYRLRAAYRTEQSELAQGTQAYLQYAEQIRAVNNELDTLRNIQGTAENDNRAQLIQQRTEALEKENAEIQRYTQLLANARAVAVGDTNPAIQQLERSLERSRATSAALTREIELLKNGFQDLVPTDATQTTANQTLALEKLKAVAEDTRRAFTETAGTNPQLTPNFQAALTASNAYYAERIRQAETALAKEKAGTDAFNALQVEIFQLGRQQLAAQRTLETERTSVLRASTQERVRIETESNNEIITGIRAVVRASREALQARVEFARQIAVIPRAGSPDAQYGNFSNLNRGAQTATASVRDLSTALLEFTGINAQLQSLDLDARIPDLDVRQQAIDERIAAETRGQQTLGDIAIDAYQQGLQFIRNLRQDDNREVQRELRDQTRYYRQFASTVSSLFTGIVTGRVQGFEEVARQFIAQSLRILSRAFIEFQVQKRLDDSLTASKIGNINKIATAQQAAGGAGIGALPGLGNLGNIGGLLSGGAGALGVAGLLFPSETRHLLGGVREEISGFLSNVAEAPDRAFGAQQVYLKIGEGEIRDITDIQTELREEDRV